MDVESTACVHGYAIGCARVVYWRDLTQFRNFFFFWGENFPIYIMYIYWYVRHTLARWKSIVSNRIHVYTHIYIYIVHIFIIFVSVCVYKSTLEYDDYYYDSSKLGLWRV